MNAVGQGEQYVSEDKIDHLAPPPGHLGPHARRSDFHCPDDGENSKDFGHDGSGGGGEEELMIWDHHRQLIWNLLLRGDAGVGVGAGGGLEEDGERSGAWGTGA